MKKFKFTILSLLGLCIIMLGTSVQAQTQPPQKPNEPKNKLGLTERQTDLAIDFVSSCIDLAKEMAEGKKKWSDLKEGDQKLYNECDEILADMFKRYLDKRRKEEAKKVASQLSPEVQEAAKLIATLEPAGDDLVLAYLYENNLENEAFGGLKAVSDLLIESLQEADREGYHNTLWYTFDNLSVIGFVNE